MTIKELKELLKQYPDDMIVLTGGFDEGDPVEPYVSKIKVLAFELGAGTIYNHTSETEGVIEAVMIDQNKWD